MKFTVTDEKLLDVHRIIYCKNDNHTDLKTSQGQLSEKRLSV